MKRVLSLLVLLSLGLIAVGCRAEGQVDDHGHTGTDHDSGRGARIDVDPK
jgi:hypothetical protein